MRRRAFFCAVAAAADAAAYYYHAAAPGGGDPGEAAAVAAADTDGDGVLSGPELRAAPALYPYTDANGDGKLNNFETRTFVGLADANDDNRISAEELASFAMPAIEATCWFFVSPAVLERMLGRPIRAQRVLRDGLAAFAGVRSAQVTATRTNPELSGRRLALPAETTPAPADSARSLSETPETLEVDFVIRVLEREVNALKSRLESAKSDSESAKELSNDVSAVATNFTEGASFLAVVASVAEAGEATTTATPRVEKETVVETEIQYVDNTVIWYQPEMWLLSFAMIGCCLAIFFLARRSRKVSPQEPEEEETPADPEAPKELKEEKRPADGGDADRLAPPTALPPGPGLPQQVVDVPYQQNSVVDIQDAPAPQSPQGDVLFERVGGRSRLPQSPPGVARAPLEGTSADHYAEEPVAVIDLTAEQPPAAPPARRPPRKEELSAPPARNPPGREELYERLKKLQRQGMGRASPDDVADIFAKGAEEELGPKEVRLKKALTRKFGKQGAKEIRNKSKNVASAFFADVTVQRPSLAPRYASG